MVNDAGPQLLPLLHSLQQRITAAVAVQGQSIGQIELPFREGAQQVKQHSVLHLKLLLATILADYYHSIDS